MERMLVRQLISTYVDIRGGLGNMRDDEKKALVKLGETCLEKGSGTFGPMPYPISPDDVVFRRKGPRKWESHGVDMAGNGRYIGEVRKTGSNEFKVKLGNWAFTRYEFRELGDLRESSLSAIKNKVRQAVAA